MRRIGLRGREAAGLLLKFHTSCACPTPPCVLWGALDLFMPQTECDLERHILRQLLSCIRREARLWSAGREWPMGFGQFDCANQKNAPQARFLDFGQLDHAVWSNQNASQARFFCLKAKEYSVRLLQYVIYYRHFLAQNLCCWIGPA